MVSRAEFTLGQLAQALGATLEGDAARVVRGIAPLESAGPDDVSFVTDTRWRAAAQTSRAGAFVAGAGVASLPGPVLRVTAPQQAMITLIELFHPAPPLVPGVHPSAVVAADARVDASAAVGPLAVIEAGARIGPAARVGALTYVGPGVEIGEGTTLGPRVTLLAGVRLGRRVIVHAGAVLGADGFGFAFDGAQHRKIPQTGGVLIEDDVEIGANTAIDRATFGDTVIRRGTKIDNLVQIGHNVQVGEHSILVSQVGISGSSTLGRGVVLAGQVGVADHVTIGDGAMVAAQGGVPSDLEGGAQYFGTPARPAAAARRIVVAETRLPELLQRVRALERAVEALGGKLERRGKRDE
ncbi:MAG TPA: UDP-3-O-(3-hydroxymyristoyl)glucosamine N-acyltransferase [Methylomirabilota bacterium]|jgi:UDP-3-O-[3-hydroxymyristoyl] glucosamine N-acyltransferase|nr:UDP-3-O-(3-hydroxymyristoyl)glucosamine N-acyltransferase [Methylomirabilota bacterium]